MRKAQLGLLAFAFLAACAGGEKVGHEDPDPGPGDGSYGEPINPCPESQPKIGDRCDFSDGTTCTFPNGPCTNANGMVYEESINYCCIDQVWSTCGGYSPCDLPPLPASIGDALRSDGPHDGGAGDASADSESDAPMSTDPGALDAAGATSS
jgi:hypothetical protein